MKLKILLLAVLSAFALVACDKAEQKPAEQPAVEEVKEAPAAEEAKTEEAPAAEEAKPEEAAK